MECLPVNLAAFLAIVINGSSLDELAETAEKIRELYDRPCRNSNPNLVNSQQTDVLAKLLEKLELLVPNTSSRRRSRQLRTTTDPGQFISRLIHVTDRKSKLIFLVDTDSEVSIIPRSAETRSLQPIYLNPLSVDNVRITTYDQKLLNLNL
ncbi:hypothetical protein ACTXT7_012299 [Hymenolepis weldensis]